jgi:STE24 endopeptidase
LAHEIGHYKKHHVVKLLGVSIAGVFTASRRSPGLARQPWFLSSIRFRVFTRVLAQRTLCRRLLLFALLAGTISFWFSPLVHIWSRRFEYEADAFAARPWATRNRLVKHCAN